MTYPHLLLRKINDRLQSNYSKRSFIHDNRMLAERAFYCLSSQISTKNLLIYHKQNLRQILFAYRIFPNRSIRSYIVPATAGVTSASAMCIKIPPETSFSLYLLYHRTEKPQAPGGCLSARHRHPITVSSCLIPVTYFQQPLLLLVYDYGHSYEL